MPAAPDRRDVRLFVSSTFRDMQAERDELTLRTFPQLRRLCESRAVVWGEVDLRWGITREEAENDQVVPLCMEEIDLCRPYFMAMIGHRYGWVPDHFPPGLFERYPHLEPFRDRSVTEMEIRHGVLNRPGGTPGDDGAVLFYFLEDAPDDDPRLLALKRKIRDRGLPVKTYRDPRHLADLAGRDLAELIERRFPPVPASPLPEAERRAQRWFVQERADVFVGREALLSRVDDHVDAPPARGGLPPAPPLVVAGPAGSGKTALLAAWVARREARPGQGAPRPAPASFAGRLRSLFRRGRSEGRPPVRELAYHFVGTSEASADIALVLRSLTGQLRQIARRRAGGFPPEIVADPGVDPGPAHLGGDSDLFPQLMSEFLAALSAAAESTHKSGGGLALVLDGLDALESRAGARELTWLPDPLPNGVRAVLGVDDGPLAEALAKRGWSVEPLPPLAVGERSELLRVYLQQRYRRRLDPEPADRLARAAAAGSPLYLRAVLEELRLVGEYERLPQAVEENLGAADADALYAAILGRYEARYERDRAGLVGDCLRLLWAAHQGLSEAEMREILGGKSGPLPQAYWSPFFLALRSSLTDRSGQWTFAHAALRRAAEARYLWDGDAVRATRLTLLSYFQNRLWTERTAEEVPGLLAGVGDWDGLAALLTDPRYLSRFNATRGAEIRRFYGLLLRTDPGALRRQLEVVLRACNGLTCAADARGFLILASLLAGAKAWGEATSLLSAVGVGMKGADAPLLAEWLTLRAATLSGTGRSPEALEALAEAEAALRRAPPARGGEARESERLKSLAACVGNQGVLLARLERLEEALDRHREAEGLWRLAQEKDGDGSGLADCQGQIGMLLYHVRGRAALPEARRLLRMQEDAYRRLGDLRRLARCLGEQARLDAEAGSDSQSESKLLEASRLFESVGDDAGWFDLLGNAARFRMEFGDLDGALNILHQREEVAARLGIAQQAETALLRAVLYAEYAGQAGAAIRYVQQAASLAERAGEPELISKAQGLRERIGAAR